MNSAVLVWPDPAAAERLSVPAARSWAARLAKDRSEIRRIFCFGSAAKGTWGVGSDLDVLLEVTASDIPFVSRPLSFEPHPLPVPVGILVYTTEEMERMRREGRRFIRDVDADCAVLQFYSMLLKAEFI